MLPTNNDECHAVEPCSKVSERPQKNAELERIDKVFDQKESTQLGYSRVSIGYSDIGDFMHLLGWQRQVKVKNLSAK